MHGDPYPIYWKINAVNNYFRVSPGFQYGMFDDQILRVPQNQLYVSGNKMSNHPSWSDYQLFTAANDFASETNPDATSRRAQAMPSRLPFPAITYTDGSVADRAAEQRGCVAAGPDGRASALSVAQDVISGAAPNINPANDALLPAYNGAAPVAPTDTDADGMPGFMEISKGLTPTWRTPMPPTLDRGVHRLGGVSPRVVGESDQP